MQLRWSTVYMTSTILQARLFLHSIQFTVFNMQVLSFVLILWTLLEAAHAVPPVVPAVCTPAPLPSSCLPDPPPGTSAKLVALGVGTQNYSCVASVPVSRGAVASLFNVTSRHVSPRCAVSQAHELKIGRHYFTQDLVPTFDVGGSARLPFTFSAAKAAAVPAPGSNSVRAVDWLYLLPHTGAPNVGAVRAAYRVRTTGGLPVSPCVGEQQVAYTAEYWFFG